MASPAAKLALVPLLAVALAFGVNGVHGRRTHDPARAAQAVEMLAPTEDEAVARKELERFFESGWVGWDVKTGVEIACGATRGRDIKDPLECLERARMITYDHQCREQDVYRRYGWLTWAAALPLLVAALLGASAVAELARRKRRAA
jgi:hypothetical protein